MLVFAHHLEKAWNENENNNNLKECLQIAAQEVNQLRSTMAEAEIVVHKQLLDNEELRKRVIDENQAIEKLQSHAKGLYDRLDQKEKLCQSLQSTVSNTKHH